MREDLRAGVASLEWKVLKQFWVSEKPLSVAGVRLALGNELNIQGVEAIVAVLVEKGYLRARPGTMVLRYAATMSRREVLRIQGMRWSERFGLEPEEMAVLAEEVGSVAKRASQLTKVSRPAK